MSAPEQAPGTPTSTQFPPLTTEPRPSCCCCHCAPSNPPGWGTSYLIQGLFDRWDISGTLLGPMVKVWAALLGPPYLLPSVCSCPAHISTVVNQEVITDSGNREQTVSLPAFRHINLCECFIDPFTWLYKGKSATERIPSYHRQCTLRKAKTFQRATLTLLALNRSVYKLDSWGNGWGNLASFFNSWETPEWYTSVTEQGAMKPSQNRPLLMASTCFLSVKKKKKKFSQRINLIREMRKCRNKGKQSRKTK